MVRPLSDNVVVRVLNEETKTEFGLIITETKKTTVTKAQVVAIGPGRTLASGVKSEMTVKIGDIVYFNEYESTPVKVENENLVVVSEQSIYVIL